MTDKQKTPRELWIEALRSGEFQQGKRALHSDDTYCCLGVLCEVYRRETGQGEWVEAADDSGKQAFVIGDAEFDQLAPDVVAEWVGFKRVEDTFRSGYTEDAQVQLACPNDQGASFLDIAAAVESATELSRAGLQPFAAKYDDEPEMYEDNSDDLISDYEPYF